MATARTTNTLQCRGSSSWTLLPLTLFSLCTIPRTTALAGGGKPLPFALGVRDSIMIAHSFKGHFFGPAQKLHGATYTVDVEFKAGSLVPKCNWVIDIGEALDTLGKILAQYNFKNLNEIFPEENTTTEFMCRTIHSDLAKHYSAKGFKGAISVKLWESHKAWASYEANI